MKRFLLCLVLVLAASVAMAEPGDRGILLSPDGTLFTVESRSNEDYSKLLSSTYLALTIQTPTGVSKMNVPASLTGGNNWQPELAYDSESGSLFVFWIHSDNANRATNQLLFCSYQDGKWSDPTAVDDVPYHIRHNLRLGVTRTVERIEASGTITKIPTLTVHTVWWDESGSEEIAKYAMVTIEKGVVTDVQRRDLADYINGAYLRSFDTSDAASDILRQPVVLESPAHDTVDVVFGNVTTNTLHRLTLKPVLNSRVRIPIGVRDDSFPAPRERLTADSNARLSAINTTSDKLVFFTRTQTAVKYLSFEDGQWNAPKSIALSTEISSDAAVAALRKMVSGD